MGTGQKKKAASQCRDNVGILEHKHMEGDPTIFHFKSVAEKGLVKTNELLRVEKSNRGLRFISRYEVVEAGDERQIGRF